MTDKYKNVKVSGGFLQAGLETQPEMLLAEVKNQKLSIGILKETSLQERRVALTPAGTSTLVSKGLNVIIERGAGDHANFTDHSYSEMGCQITSDRKKIFDCDILLKVAPPSVDEIELMHPNQILISPLHLPTITSEYLEKLLKRRVIAMAMEYIQDSEGRYPLVRVLSEMAGINAILIAADLLVNAENARGVLLGGIAGVPPATVVILGAGIVGEFAARTAIGLGAEVQVFDDNINKLMRLQKNLGRPVHTSVINPIHLQKKLISADVAIGAIHSKNGRTPMIVTDEMVSKMKPGSVIIDVSIDQGGCFETSILHTLEKKYYSVYDVIHFAVPNIASKIPRTSSMAVSNILAPLVQKIGQCKSVEELLYHNAGFRHGVYTYKGCLTNKYLSERFDQKYTDIDLLLMSNL